MGMVFLEAVNRNVVIIEGVIAVVIILLLVGIIVTSQRKKKAAAPKPPAEVPNYYADLQQQPAGRSDPFGNFAAATSPSAAPATPPPVNSAPSTFAQPSVPGPTAAPAPGPIGAPAAGTDLGPSVQAAPAATGSSWPSSDAWAPSGPAAQPDATGAGSQPAAATATVAPHTAAASPGTPAGWLPDPSGTPDTLRYWDGNAWTQHFAQRS